MSYNEMKYRLKITKKYYLRNWMKPKLNAKKLKKKNKRNQPKNQQWLLSKNQTNMIIYKGESNQMNYEKNNSNRE